MSEASDAVFGIVSLEDRKAGIRQALADHAERVKARPPKPGEKRISERDFFLGSDTPRTTRSDFNERAKRYMDRKGWKWERVDYYDARTGRHHDLLGMFDYLAFDGRWTIGVQITSRGQMSTRRKKILAEKRFAWLKGWKVLILGFDSDREVKEDWITP